ncbi:hypothetical protein NDU88_004549 [Pleurodeles waltl]|uniref:Uncharacterized protein n=1 Tax=Pleurodeles waltl TaxID=8319 RepID=A0AAV7RG11_PLEWA|nr:hypothetical protein NDU88_004549 [Pleurodeles waltl]
MVTSGSLFSFRFTDAGFESHTRGTASRRNMRTLRFYYNLIWKCEFDLQLIYQIISMNIVDVLTKMVNPISQEKRNTIHLMNLNTVSAHLHVALALEKFYKPMAVLDLNPNVLYVWKNAEDQKIVDVSQSQCYCAKQME